MAGLSARGLASFRLRLVGALIMIVIGMSLGATYTIYADRERQIGAAFRSLESLAYALNREAESTLRLAENTLEGTILELNLDVPSVYDDTFTLHRALVLKRRALTLKDTQPSFGHLFILGADGHNLANSVSYPIQQVDASSYEFFQYHKRNPSDVLYISQPTVSSVTEERLIYLTKRLEAKDGTFLGVLGVHFKLTHFDQLYRQLGLPDGGIVTVMRHDGWGVFQYPMQPNFFDINIKDAPPFQLMLKNKVGADHYISPYDGVRRVGGYQVSTQYPLISIITVTRESVLAPWRNNATSIALLALCGSLIIFALIGILYFQLETLRKALTLSTHDPLTGLSNRRAFDERMDEEWRRAMRHSTSLAMAFIDVDYFKRYNDTYGHSKGDDCLKKIAQTLQDKTKRAGEMVARYGGEEFVVIYSNTSAAEALQEAERLRLAVTDLEIPHSSSDIDHRVTISIGVAAFVPTQGLVINTLMEQADEALYDAKQAGRNAARAFCPVRAKAESDLPDAATKPQRA